MTMWAPDLAARPGPRYRALVDALSEEVAEGRLPEGTRLPPQRDLAYRLGVTIGTVSRAYALAAERGLVTGEVGRGTFVRRPAASTGRTNPVSDGSGDLIKLTVNAPPDPGYGALIAERLAEIAARPGATADLWAYTPKQGFAEHRAAAARWIAGVGLDAVAGAHDHHRRRASGDRGRVRGARPARRHRAGRGSDLCRHLPRRRALRGPPAWSRPGRRRRAAGRPRCGGADRRGAPADRQSDRAQPDHRHHVAGAARGDRGAGPQARPDRGRGRSLRAAACRTTAADRRARPGAHRLHRQRRQERRARAAPGRAAQPRRACSSASPTPSTTCS